MSSGSTSGAYIPTFERFFRVAQLRQSSLLSGLRFSECGEPMLVVFTFLASCSSSCLSSSSPVFRKGQRSRSHPIGVRLSRLSGPWKRGSRHHGIERPCFRSEVHEASFSNTPGTGLLFCKEVWSVSALFCPRCILRSMNLRHGPPPI